MIASLVGHEHAKPTAGELDFSITNLYMLFWLHLTVSLSMFLVTVNNKFSKNLNIGQNLFIHKMQGSAPDRLADYDACQS